MENEEMMYKSLYVNEIADAIQNLDSEGIDMLAVQLVLKNHLKADSLAWALGCELQEMLMSHGFSSKINEVA